MAHDCNKMKLCPITETLMTPVFRAKVLNKYDVQYYFSKESGLLQTEKPYWLTEAYKTPIPNIDTGLISRNVYYQRVLESIIWRLFNPKGKFLDIGGGYGILARLMRDIGYDFYTYDKYDQNIFSTFFIPYLGFNAEALIAIEVLEHVENPIEFLTEYFKKYFCNSIIFSTLTFNGQIPPKNWWYYSFEYGQHITFYQPKTLNILANKLNCNYYNINNSLHIITGKKIKKKDYYILSHKYTSKVYRLYVRYMRRKMNKVLEHQDTLENRKNENDF